MTKDKEHITNQNPVSSTYDKLNLDSLTPMMKQYWEIKKAWPETILMYRLGDFYEMFFDDALVASKVLELALTGRECGQEDKAPMCGVPHHAAANYMQKLVSNGYKVAICDQTEDPSQAKGIVKREVIKVLTPGTITDLNTLDEKSNNYLLSIYKLGNQYGLAAADLSTGSFEATEFIRSKSVNQLLNQIARYNPKEILCNPSFHSDPILKTILEVFHPLITVREESNFALEKIESFLQKDSSLLEKRKPSPSSSPSENGWTFSKVNNMLYKSAANALLLYLEETQQQSIPYLQTLKYFQPYETMELDWSTRKNLELTETLRHKSKKGSLLWAIDMTKTPMGGRRLRQFVEQPLIEPEKINQRLDAVEELKNNFILRQQLVDKIQHLHDMERLSTRISLGTVHARDLLALKNSLAYLPNICALVSNFHQGAMPDLKNKLEPLDDLFQFIDDAIAPEPPITLKEGGIIKSGYHPEVDELRTLTKDSKQLLLDLEISEKEKTGIKTLRVGYNRVFGYYVEVSKGSVEQVPESYIRKQTLANGERYITEELKILEDKILGAQQRLTDMEYQLFTEIRQKIALQTNKLLQVCQGLADLDVYVSLAELAAKKKYTKPLIDTSSILKIEDGRHPVIEEILPTGDFVPNNSIFQEEEHRIMIITGPNMAGKSTYMRQVALIVLLAQIGSFVPASFAHIGVVDRIFTRIGASDDLAAGQSTFMVEMNEVATILENATSNSLLLLDEVGRGTSTFDGLSIAWSILEYISQPSIMFPRTLFATHYHELNQLENLRPGIVNYHVEVKRLENTITFLHKIMPGGIDDSFGIEVAQLAGVPEAVVKRAKIILHTLEQNQQSQNTQDTSLELGINPLLSLAPMESIMTSEPMLIKSNPLQEELLHLDISKMTPLEAMNSLHLLIQLAQNLQ